LFTQFLSLESLKTLLTALLFCALCVVASGGAARAQSGRHPSKSSTSPATPTEDEENVKPPAEPSLKFPSHASPDSNQGRQCDVLAHSVRTVRAEQALFHYESNKWVEDPRTLRSIYDYDIQGNLTKVTDYADDGSLRRRIFYLYDDNGNKIAEVTYGSYRAHSHLLFKHVFAYDAYGKVTEEAYYNPDGTSKYRGVTIYDARGNKVKSVRYSSAATISSTQIYTPEGKVAEETIYNAKGSMESRSVYSYDAKGHTTEEAYYKPNGKLYNESRPDYSRRVYIYDDNGNMTEERDYNADGSTSWRIHYIYDTRGNITEETHYHGDILHHQRIYTYEFDPAGNWIKRVMSEEATESGRKYFKPMDALYRTIYCY